MVGEHRIVREELGRSAVWLLFSIFGWALVLTQTTLPESGLLWGGLVSGSVAAMTALMIVLRVATGETFRSQGDLVFFLVTLFGGMYVVYLGDRVDLDSDLRTGRRCASQSRGPGRFRRPHTVNGGF